MTGRKKGVSVMLGYVLLVSIVVVMGIIVFNYLKTYVIQEELECPEGVSLYMDEYSCDSASNQLSVILRNSGRFDIAGYFIKGANVEDVTVATINLVSHFNKSASPESTISMGNAILAVEGGGNFFIPGKNSIAVFNIEGLNLKLIEINPFRYEKQKDGRLRLVQCSDSTIRERIVCTP